MQRVSAILAGVATGLLLGTLVGLSVSPVVSAVVGGLVALLATFLGLKDDPPTPPPGGGSGLVPDARRFGIAGFGFACLVAIIAAVSLRSRDVLGMTPAEQVKLWTDAGYPPAQARSIVALKAAGIVPLGATIQKQSATETPASAGVLFGADVQYCDKLNPRDYADAANLSRAFESSNGAWKKFSGVVGHVPDERIRLQLLTAGWELVCA